jgi:hypothetical protein
LKTLIVTLTLITTTLGCLSTHQITNDQTGYDQLNTILSDQRGIVTLQNEEEYAGVEILIGTDSTRGVDVKRSTVWDIEKNPWRIATSDIKMIQIKDHIRGGLIGFGTGFVLGAIFGVIFAEAMATSTSEEATFGDYFLASGGFGLVCGVIFGLPALVIGYKEKYLLIPPDQETEK